ncbi:MerR family transcriptional regulator [Nocardia sp. NPDC049149]|uniref:MerR family transcriptional regulator n=1 Tax=Nocardia sp. NPDC049149 TaxID=3364315 RepID=UPI003715E568
MTEDTHAQVREIVSIGELSRRTSVPVRTIRFYCDSGVLRYQRSSAGHRIFDSPTAIDRLLLVRRLRALGLSLTAIVPVLDGTASLGDAVAAERAALDTELDTLRWRRAALLAVESAPVTQRPQRLELLAAVHDRSAVLDTVVEFWRPILAPLPREQFDGFIDMTLPPLPSEPDPSQVVAYAELTALATDPQVKTAMARQIWRSDHAAIRDRHHLVTAIPAVYAVVAPLVAANETPRPGAELDQFVHAHATARRERDTPQFRHRLLAGAPDNDPRLRRYWRSTAEITGPEPTLGAFYYWLIDALRTTA